MESIAEAPLTAQVTPGLLPRFQDGAVNLLVEAALSGER
jgi:hypothetical protein